MISEKQTEFEVCLATERHAESLAELHSTLFSHGWPREDFLSFISNNNDLVLVAKDQLGGCLIGFVVVRMVLDEAEILTIGIAGDHQKRGVGTQLYQVLEEILKKRKIEKLFLELRRSNVAANGLYKKTGFKLVATRKGYYRSLCGDRREDALIIKKDI